MFIDYLILIRISIRFDMGCEILPPLYMREFLYVLFTQMTPLICSFNSLFWKACTLGVDNI